MKRILRRSDPSWVDYAYVLLFAAAYVTTMILVVSPETIVGGPAEQPATLVSE